MTVDISGVPDLHSTWWNNLFQHQVRGFSTSVKARFNENRQNIQGIWNHPDRNGGNLKDRIKNYLFWYSEIMLKALFKVSFYTKKLALKISARKIVLPKTFKRIILMLIFFRAPFLFQHFPFQENLVQHPPIEKRCKLDKIMNINTGFTKRWIQYSKANIKQ